MGKTDKHPKQDFNTKLSNDKRFASIATDPKFITAPKSVTKVKVDKRFNKMKDMLTKKGTKMIHSYTLRLVYAIRIA